MRRLILAAPLALLAAPALAHSGHGATEGFLHGLAHPVLGPDHLLAMLAVGMWSGIALPGRIWAGAAAFMAAMVAGAGLSWAGIGFPMVETWIAASVMVFGILVIAAWNGHRQGIISAMLVAIAAFALAHGHAHATEATGTATAYLAGFLTATGALHLAGIALARALAHARAGQIAQRMAGGAITLTGLWMLAGG